MIYKKILSAIFADSTKTLVNVELLNLDETPNLLTFSLTQKEGIHFIENPEALKEDSKEKHFLIDDLLKDIDIAPFNDFETEKNFEKQTHNQKIFMQIKRIEESLVRPLLEVTDPEETEANKTFAQNKIKQGREDIKTLRGELIYE